MRIMHLQPAYLLCTGVISGVCKCITLMTSLAHCLLESGCLALQRPCLLCVWGRATDPWKGASASVTEDAVASASSGRTATLLMLLLLMLASPFWARLLRLGCWDMLDTWHSPSAVHLSLCALECCKECRCVMTSMCAELQNVHHLSVLSHRSASVSLRDVLLTCVGTHHAICRRADRKISAKSQGKSNIQLFTTLPFTGRAQRRQALSVMQRRISASPVTCWIAQCISEFSNCYLLLLLPPSSSGARLKYEVTISRTNTRVMRSATAPLPGRLMASSMSAQELVPSSLSM